MSIQLNSGRLALTKRGFLALIGIACFIITYIISIWEYYSMGQFFEKLIFSVMFISLGILTFLMAFKGFWFNLRKNKEKKKYTHSDLIHLVFPLTFCFLFITIFIYVTLPKQLEDRDFFSKALETNGIIIGINASHEDPDIGMEHKIIIEFIDYRTGQQVTAITPWQHISYPWTPTIGIQVPILYYPDNPTTARIDDGYRATWSDFFKMYALIPAFFLDFIIPVQIWSYAKRARYIKGDSLND